REYGVYLIDDEKTRRVPVVAFCQKLVVIAVGMAHMCHRRQPDGDRRRQLAHLPRAGEVPDLLDVGVWCAGNERGEGLVERAAPSGSRHHPSCLSAGRCAAGKASMVAKYGLMSRTGVPSSASIASSLSRPAAASSSSSAAT